MTRKFVRTDMGPYVSEGCRVLWQRFLASGADQVTYARSVGTTGSYLNLLLYAERKPGRKLANTLQEHAGIPSGAWDRAPSKPVSPPGAKRMRKAA